MLEALLVLLIVAVIALAVTLVLLYRRLWLLMGSVECLCTHIGRSHGHG
jgi:cell division protein FtsL